MKKLIAIFTALMSLSAISYYCSFETANANTVEGEIYYSETVINSILNSHVTVLPKIDRSSDIFETSDGRTVMLKSVNTPKRSSVEVFVTLSMKNFDAAKINESIDNQYPNATRLASANYNYNCHSYAWYSASTTYNTYWMNDPSPYYSDGSFYESTAKVGNIVCYYNSRGQNLHSAVITSIDSNKSGLSAITVKSKWGSAGLYQHSVDYCPYYPISGGSAVYVKFYEHESHTYNNHYTYKDSTCHKSFCSCGDYILGGHYMAATARVNKHELHESEDMHAVVGPLFSVCALCNGVLDPDKFYPSIITSLSDDKDSLH